MIGNLIGGIVKGYAGATMEKQKTERQAAEDSANRRLKLITSILPDLTDPSLRAEAISMAEETAGGPKKKGGGGLSGILQNLLGRYETNEPEQQKRFQEFIQRPRQIDTTTPGGSSERPALEQPASTLPDLPGLSKSLTTTAPGMVSRTVKGPFATPDELIALETARAGAMARQQAQVKAEVGSADWNRNVANARAAGVTDPIALANAGAGHPIPQLPQMPLAPVDIEVDGKRTPALYNHLTGQHFTLEMKLIDPKTIRRLKLPTAEESTTAQNLEVAYQAYADKYKKSVAGLTAQEKVKAQAEHKSALEDPSVAAQRAATLALTRDRLDRQADLIEPLGAADPTSNAILGQTGLSLKGFYALVGESSKLPRDAATRKAAIQEAAEFSKKRGIDTATLASQYKTYNTVLSGNIARLNNTKIMESELQGTIENLQQVVNAKDLSRVNFANVAKVWMGQQVNDPLAQQYAVHLSQLRNELTAYYAATQGRSGNQIMLADEREAANVIRNGIASGSLAGLSAAVKNSTGKMGTVMQRSVDNAARAIWSLFGVGQNYKGAAGPLPNVPAGEAAATNYQQTKVDTTGKKWGWSPGMKEWQPIQ